MLEKSSTPEWRAIMSEGNEDDISPRIYTINPKQRVVVRNGVFHERPKPKRKTHYNHEPGYNNGIVPYGVKPTQDSASPKHRRRKKQRKLRESSEEPQITPLYGPQPVPHANGVRGEKSRHHKANGNGHIPKTRQRKAYAAQPAAVYTDPVAPVINSMTAYEYYYPPTRYRESKLSECFSAMFSCLTCKCAR